MPDEVKAEELQHPDVSLAELVQQLAHERGLDLRGYKQGTLGRRLRKRMSELGLHNYREYLERVQLEPTEVNALLNTLLINVTEFFRDPQAWEVLRTQVLPRLLQDMETGSSFRAWCAGCASGEEAYSLAILLAEHFGPRLSEVDVKIYGTDVDQEALNAARRGEYAMEKLRRVRSELRERYFSGNGVMMRIIRDVRRMLIFGRSNLMADAPISHCDLVICRNVLIYFDSAAQRHIFSRLYYALEPHGVLFLGKAESKLTESPLFRPLNSRWRFFQKISAGDAGEPRGAAIMDERRTSGDGSQAAQQEANKLRLEQKHILETLKSGIIVLDHDDVITNHNEVAPNLWGVSGVRLAGRRIQNTELIIRCPELGHRLNVVHNSSEPSEFKCSVKVNGEERLISVTMRPITADGGERTGTLMHCEDITNHDKLQSTVEQLEATSEELQSANEELETTNEELQSTNEELETTNEELQSTNEELETTNEELHSLNEELENMNEELEHRTKELNDLTTRYAETLRRMPWPVILLDNEHKIQLWNAVAQKLFGVGATSVSGVEMARLPLEESLRTALLRRCNQVLAERRPVILRDRHIKGAPEGNFDIHFTPIVTGDKIEGVMVMFASSQPPMVQPAKKRTPEKARAKAAGNNPVKPKTARRSRKKRR